MDWCRVYWTCGTQYEMDVYRAGPVTPCARPHPDYQPPALPGRCQFNVSAGQCQFQPNSTSECAHLAHVVDL